jgi:taspase (threonine aspartase 1)
MFSNKRGRKFGDTACIFVHAGAGYHSQANEMIHLAACNEWAHITRASVWLLLMKHSAARLGMNVLKTGGSAVDAVEIALKCLEDREITNAGYGSNLAMDGVVECDALIVDHNGRSGGAGAVARESFQMDMSLPTADLFQKSRTQSRLPDFY